MFVLTVQPYGWILYQWKNASCLRVLVMLWIHSMHHDKVHNLEIIFSKAISISKILICINNQEILQIVNIIYHSVINVDHYGLCNVVNNNTWSHGNVYSNSVVVIVHSLSCVQLCNPMDGSTWGCSGKQQLGWQCKISK